MRTDNMYFFPKGQTLHGSIAEGTVYKFEVLRTDTYEVSLLRLTPNSTIKPHVHDKDSELYAIIQDGRVESWYCPKGASHNLYNGDKDDMLVISVKFFTDITEEEAYKIMGRFA